MSLQRIDQMTTPPVKGRYYLVPAIYFAYGVWGDPAKSERSRWWPVTGEMHTDKEFFDFDSEHYHLDLRFLTRRHLNEFYRDDHRGHSKLLQAMARPLHQYGGWVPPPPIVRRMRCIRTTVDYDAEMATGYKNPKRTNNLRCAYKGVQCRKDAQGWVCPHRLALLGSMQPNAAGVITCTLHGLHIDAKTGVCL